MIVADVADFNAACNRFAGRGQAWCYRVGGKGCEAAVASVGALQGTDRSDEAFKGGKGASQKNGSGDQRTRRDLAADHEPGSEAVERNLGDDANEAREGA